MRVDRCFGPAARLPAASCSGCEMALKVGEGRGFATARAFAARARYSAERSHGRSHVRWPAKGGTAAGKRAEKYSCKGLAKQPANPLNAAPSQGVPAPLLSVRFYASLENTE